MTNDLFDDSLLFLVLVLISLPFIVVFFFLAEAWDYLRDRDAYNYFNKEAG